MPSFGRNDCCEDECCDSGMRLPSLPKLRMPSFGRNDCCEDECCDSGFHLPKLRMPTFGRDCCDVCDDGFHLPKLRLPSFGRDDCCDSGFRLPKLPKLPKYRLVRCEEECDVEETTCSEPKEKCCREKCDKEKCCKERRAKDDCCDADPCVIAELIYESQTACYATKRRAALRKLGAKFNCTCNPEIMVAFVYALNDSDERVRAKAADEIGDQFRKNPCCCSPEITEALTCALGDCDRRVRTQAKQALKICGYDVQKGCCHADRGCEGAADEGHDAAEGEAAPATEEAAPAPESADPNAYFPSRLRQKQVSQSKLSNLFGLIN